MNFLCQWMVLTTLLAAGPAPTDAVPNPSRAGEVVALFHDGTILRRVGLHESVEITTKYGKLMIPVSDIRRIDFGFRLSEDVARRVDVAIKQLGSEQFSAREAAGKELVALGSRAYPALQAASRSADKEVATRATAALERIREEVPEEELRFKEEDVIHARDCVLAGRIQGPALKGQTANFGELPLKLADLRSLYSAGVSKLAVKVDGGLAGNFPEKWLDTGFEVDADMGLVLAGSGQLDLLPQTPGQHMSGPEGYVNAGQFAGYLPGTLLGRIGEKGDIFIIGQRYEGKSTQAGKLYLHIVPVQGGGKPTGEYTVKITAGYEIAPSGQGNATRTGRSSRTTGPGSTVPANGFGGRGGRAPRGGQP